ncbi:MAG TPA: hypothetical protein VH740_07685 [Vicinamibacterales bacterium]
MRTLLTVPLRRAAIAAVLTIASASPGVAGPGEPQAIDALLFRIFLRDGSTLVSYGDFARVADRVVFSIPIGGLDTPSPALHLVSIAESAVDWERTDRYTEATRARHYAETRGEADFSELSDRVARALNDVALTKNPAKRLALATDARRMLGAWPAAHYGYRASDVKQLAALLDDAISELRVGAGLPRFDLTLVAIADSWPASEPAMPAPTPRESLDQAFAAASLTPNSAERVSLLEAIMHTLSNGAGGAAWAPTMNARAASALAVEARIDKEYADLVSRTIAAADERSKRADVRGLDTLLRNVLKADDKLGRRRPETTAALLATIDTKLDSARRLRLARDSWAIRQEGVRKYQRSVQPALERFRRSIAGLEQIRLLSGPSPDALRPLAIRLSEAWADLRTVRSNAETAQVHGMLVSAMQMALRAATTRRLAINATDMTTAWEASSAAAGALLLFERAQEELRKLNTPPGT